MIVALTGANGFLGSHIARALTRAGLTVRALVRQGASTRYLKRLQHLELRELADTSLPCLRQALAGADALVHNAALARDWGRYRDFHEANVLYTRRALEVAAELGIRQVVHISSNAVLGEEDCREPKAVSAPYRARLPYLLEGLLPSAMNHYRVTKAEGEKAALEIARGAKLDLTVLRPVWIFGPREEHSGPYEYCRTVVSGTPLFPGTDDNLFHAVYVEDVARAVRLALAKRLPGVHLFNIGPKEVLPMRRYFGLYCAALGRKQPAKLPKWLLYPLALLLEASSLLLRTKNPPLLTRARLYMLYANNVYDVSDAERLLGFRAETDLALAVRKTVRWWRLNRFLPKPSSSSQRSS
ncbi:MAG: NAD-dependent epimerase/dehydratase family protein [Deltaproteobacteria bacterium]|nr:NAD-dependent epimerase/dehydratase family protein [Deltaproteobacteria bacterium]